MKSLALKEFILNTNSDGSDIFTREGNFANIRMKYTDLAVVVESEDGNTLFTVALKENGALEITSGGFVKMEGKVLDTTLVIRPRGASMVVVEREPYKS